MTTYGTPDLNHALEGPEDAPVLVLSNSSGTTPGLWEEQAPALRKRFGLLRRGARGPGGSSAPPGPYGIVEAGRDVPTLLRRPGTGRASLRGVCVGGMMGMWPGGGASETTTSSILDHGEAR